MRLYLYVFLFHFSRNWIFFHITKVSRWTENKNKSPVLQFVEKYCSVTHWNRVPWNSLLSDLHGPLFNPHSLGWDMTQMCTARPSGQRFQASRGPLKTQAGWSTCIRTDGADIGKRERPAPGSDRDHIFPGLHAPTRKSHK